MGKINQREYEILKALDDKWEWIARDEDSDKSTFPNELWIYEYMPKKGIPNWLGGGGATKRFCYDNDFRFIRWEEENPWNIQELVEDYEVESGGSEVKKDLEWYRRKLERLREADMDMWNRSEPNSEDEAHFSGSIYALDKALEILEELENPKVEESE